MLLLLLCSSFFAFHNSSSAFSSDEVWSVSAASSEYDVTMATLRDDIHPPLYYQILFGWVRVFGSGERAVRSLSGLFYIMSVFAIYGLARDLLGGKTALVCAAIYLASPLAILAAQFARMYALLSLLSILSTWLYLQFSVRPRRSELLYVAYIIINALGTFTHLAFFFLIFAQLIVHFLFKRTMGLKRLVLAITASLVPYLFLWAPVLVRQIASSGEGLAWVRRPGPSMILDLLLLYGGVVWLLIPLWYLIRKRGVQNWRASIDRNIVSLTVSLLGITILTPLLISLVKPIFNSRLAIVGLHLFALTIGALIGRRVNDFLPIAMVLLTAVFFVVLHPERLKCDNREMAGYLNRTANDNDIVIFTSLTRLPIDYYRKRSPTKRKLIETSFPAEIDQHPGYEGRISDPGRKAALEREAEQLIEKFASLRSAGSAPRIFFFHGFRPEIDAIIADRIGQRFELLPDQGVRCDGTESYFKELSVYK